jgi:hypothetical protein
VAPWLDTMSFVSHRFSAGEPAGFVLGFETSEECAHRLAVPVGAV